MTEQTYSKSVFCMQRVLLCVALLLATAGVARGDVGLVLNSSMATGSSYITSAGHASLYLSRVCAETPVRVRMCREGEAGSVLSNYSNFHEDRPYGWNIVPVSIYLYGVEEAENRPLYATPELQAALRESYRVHRLGALCQTEDCRENPDANWTDMVGATFVRTVYIFTVKTTVAQDEALVARLNSEANVSHYSGPRQNCADFAREILNSYFPHAVHGNPWNDFGMTSPKAVARSLTHYAEHHRQLELRVTRFTQLPSNIRRSDPARIGTETICSTKKFLLPMMVFPEGLAVFSGSYLLTGRFSAERAARRHGPDEELLAGLKMAGPDGPGGETGGDGSGDARGWDDYRKAWARQEAEAKELGIIRQDADLARAFGEMQRLGVPRLDEDGRPWMDMPVEQDGRVGSRVVGLTESALTRSQSEASARLAYKFQLARVRFYLHSRGMDREDLPEFARDWELMQAARNVLRNGSYEGDRVQTAQVGHRAAGQ